MTPDKRNLLIFSSFATVVVVATIIWFVVSKNRLEEERLEEEERQQQEQQQAIEDAWVKPKFNRNGELINPLSELKGKRLLSKNDNVNVRATAKVDNGSIWVPYSHNVLMSVKKGKVVGTVVGEVMGSESPKMRWFKIKLEKPLQIALEVTGVDPITTTLLTAMQFTSDRSPKTYNYAYVRADVVTFDKYKK